MTQSGDVFDYVIVGAGPAGCVLAHRLSADPAVSVLLVEAGGHDTDPLMAMPRGAGQLFGDSNVMWHHPTRPFGPAGEVEQWLRGRTLGGSSSVNGMVYNRGSRADHDALERLGNPGWGWDDMAAAFTAIEDHPLGASEGRGVGGRLQLSTAHGGDDPLLEDVIAAGTELGWQPTPDPNGTDEERIGHVVATVRDGRRVSAATAFLHPVMDRANLTVETDTTIDRVVIADGRAVGVRGRQDGRQFDARAVREVLLSAGAIGTPKILQLSGVGPAEALGAAGVPVVLERAAVGARLREHRVLQMQVRLKDDLGYNRLLSTEEGQRQAMEEYRTARCGVFAAPTFDIIGFVRTRPDLERPDVQLQIAPYSIAPREQGAALEVEREPGMMGIGYALRPDSEGSIAITSDDPDAPLDIDANYLATDHDRTTTVGAMRALRRLFATEPLAARIERETVPGPAVESDQEVEDFALTVGSAGYHAIGTCAMGPTDDDVVDPRLQVRGVADLRVVDASVLPIMVSGNLNGPVTALAWRAADFILDAA